MEMTTSNSYDMHSSWLLVLLSVLCFSSLTIISSQMTYLIIMLYFKTLINMKLRQPPLVCFYGHKNCVVSVKGIKEKKSDLKSEFSQKFVAFLNFEMQV